MRHEQKTTLYKFVTLYYISTFILLGIIAILYYNTEYQMVHNLTISKMKNSSSEISSTLITSHMYNKKIDINKLLNKDRDLKISAYDSKQHILYGTDNRKVNLEKKQYMIDDLTVIVDTSPLGHQGIHYLVVIDKMFQDKIYKIKAQTIIFFALSYLFICLIGYYLVKLFMQPIHDERKRLDNFIKDTTHELNTPITAIIMCTAKEQLNNPKNMERIYLSAKRLSEIYNDLTYSFLSNDNEKTIQSINIKNLLSSQLEYFTLLASKKNIAIKTDIHDLYINISSENINRLFSNVLSNSIKYNKRGGEISVILKENYLIISDTGIGIDSKKMNNIFNRYYRATEESGGFGLGLSIVKQICDSNNIDIKLQSEINNGSSFTFTFKV